MGRRSRDSSGTRARIIAGMTEPNTSRWSTVSEAGKRGQLLSKSCAAAVDLYWLHSARVVALSG